ncbi:ATP-binding protein [Pseudomonas sp. LRF_L74]|uniref:PAS domain-containing sensor histidine kinase n=1 Tax=Pseudomonas sp. LRF_L74 TaxID=3369422 RepID=UPI003F5E6537
MRLFGQPQVSDALGLQAPPGGLALQLDRLGTVLAVGGDRSTRLPGSEGARPLREYLSRESAAYLDDELASHLGASLDLDFVCLDGTPLNTRGWLRREQDGWLLVLQDISDVLAQARSGESRLQGLLESWRLGARLRDSVYAHMRENCAEVLQQLAQRLRMPNLALALNGERGWQVYAHYHRLGDESLWRDCQALGEALDNGLARPALIDPLAIDVSPALAALLGDRSGWLVPFHEAGRCQACLIAVGYDPRGAAPDVPVEDWLQFCAVIVGPLLRRLAEHEQSHRLGRMQALQRLLGSGWWEYQAETQRFDVAPELAQVWGLEQQPSLEQWLEAIHPADRDEFRVRLRGVESGSAGFVQSLRLRRDGEAWQRVQALALSEGRQRRIVGCTLDVSDIKHEEARATSAHARLRNLVASAPAVIYVQAYAEGALELEFCSDSLTPLLGWRTEDLRASQLADKVHPEDIELFFSRTRELLREGGVSRRYRLRDNQGSYHWLLDEAKLLRDELGQPREAVGLWLDVTEATQAAERIRESEERYRILVEDSPAMICRYSPDLRLIFANRPLADYLERTPQQMVGANLGDWLSDEQRQAFNERLLALTPEQPLGTAEIYLQLPGRQQAWWIWADRGIFDEQGRLLEIQAVGRDNTEVRHAQQQLFQGAKMATLGEMATGMAHEMNQPLNVMRMAVANVLKRLASDTQMPPQYLQDKLVRIEAQIQRAARIVDHMRVFGRRSEIERQVFDPLQALEGALSLLDEGLRGKGVELRVEVPEATAPVQGHADQLEQVLINLMVNARDAMLGKQEQQPRLQPWIRLSASHDEQQVKLWVEDNGGGIEPRILGRIFEPFFTTKPVGKGTGLGLSVSYGIVQQMGGTLSVENVGQGARFCIALPIVESTSAVEDGAAPGEA